MEITLLMITVNKTIISLIVLFFSSFKFKINMNFLYLFIVYSVSRDVGSQKYLKLLIE